MGKVIFTVFVISPFAKPEAVNLLNVALSVGLGLLSWLLGYILDGMKVER